MLKNAPCKRFNLVFRLIAIFLLFFSLAVLLSFKITRVGINFFNLRINELYFFSSFIFLFSALNKAIAELIYPI